MSGAAIPRAFTRGGTSAALTPFAAFLDRAPHWARLSFGAVPSLLVLVLALAIRLIALRQPLVENFIDRQVHTAMMARNLMRGSSLLYPEIDIGPFPAHYMLEFPGYPWLVGVAALFTGAPLDATGRLVSALAMAAACWFLFDLVRRHDGTLVALLAAAALATMPVTVRFGRAFQPDSVMFMSLMVAIWAMDRWAARGPIVWLCVAALATGGALLLKVISAYILLPIAYLAWKRLGWSFLGRWQLWLSLAVAIVPALAWYVHAWHVAATGETVSTPFWQTHKWISLSRFTDITSFRQLSYFVGLRVLTPIGVLLAVLGALMRPTKLFAMGPSQSGADPTQPMLFHVWLAALALYLPILMRKVDHEHYYLAVAPIAALLIARALVAIASLPIESRCYVTGPIAAGTLGVALLGCNLIACRSTFRNPAEWRHVTGAAAAAREWTRPESLVAAHSSVLFYADRRGFTFAYGSDEIDYLFDTWGLRNQTSTPASLLEFYRQQGAEYFVELLGTNRERDNRSFFEFVRSQYRIVHEEPGEYLVVALRQN